MSTSDRTTSDAAYDIETFAAQALAQAMRVADQMTGCANRHNLAIIEAYRRAAAIARDPRRNTHCSNCGDTRGGPFGHEISECTWLPPVGVFEEREQCRGDDIPDLVAAAERRGWAQAIEALRAEAERINPSGGSPVGVSNTTMWAVYVSAADWLEGRAAALTEEGGQ